MIDLKRVSWAKLLVAAAMTIVPATLSYCKASMETTSARSASRAENEASYKTLVDSVRQLQLVVATQQETLALLAQKSGVAMSGLRMNDAGAGSGSGGTMAAASSPVDFPALPDSAHEALQMQSAK